MRIVPTTGHAALLMLRQTAAREASPSPKAPPPTVTPRDIDPRSPAAKILLGAVPQGTRTEAAASAKAGDSLFSVNRVTGEKLLMKRVEQLGKALGVERSRYDDFAEFSAAVKDTVRQLTATPGGKRVIDAIAVQLKLNPETIALLKEQKSPEMLFRLLEKHLGLDQLGISVESLVTAAQDPKGAEAQAIIEILLRDSGSANEDRAGRAPVPVTTDEVGLYRVAGGRKG